VISLDLDTVAKLAAPIITLIGGALLKYFTEARSRVVSFVGHISSFTLQDEKRSAVFSHSIVVRNAGTKAAKNVRLGHNVFPKDINIYPSVQYSVEVNPEGKSEIVIPTLVPKEQVTISYLYFPPVTVDRINSYTKSDEGFAKIINVIPMPQPSRFIAAGAWGFAFIGVSFVIYWLFRLVAYVI
jgi:hypothetical protein